MHGLLRIVGILLCAGLFGCASNQHYSLDPNNRALLGKSIGIRVQPVVANPIIDTPFMHYRSNVSLPERLSGAGRQAVQGAGLGAKSGAYVLAGGCGHGKGCIVILAVALAATASGATIGGMTGAVSGVLAGQVELDQGLADVINQAGIPQNLEEAIFTELAGLQSHQVARVSDRNVAGQASDSQSSVPIESQGSDSVIELTLKRMAFVGSSPTGPHYLSIDTKVRVLTQSDHKLIATRDWRYNSDEWSRSYPLAEWQANNGQLLSEAINHFSKQTAGHVRSEIFGLPMIIIPAN